MKKFVIILIATFLLLTSFPTLSKAVPPKRNQYEDTVSESIWDWTTTLGKSPQEKKRIKAQRRIQRIKKRAEKKSKIEKVNRDKKNKIRRIEAQKKRAARIQKKRRELKGRKR